jgi:hypothetical protein
MSFFRSKIQVFEQVVWENRKMQVLASKLAVPSSSV